MPTIGDSRRSYFPRRESSKNEGQRDCLRYRKGVHYPIEIGKDGVGTGKFVCLFCHSLL